MTGGQCRALAVCGLVLAAATPGAARGQGDVRGRLTVVERDGAATADLANAVVFLEPVGASVPAAAPSAAAPLAGEIAMREREFVPHVRVVLAGGSVAFPNDDPFSHNVFSNTATNAFDLGLYRSHASRSARFTHPGIYPIYCNIHHRMVSFVVAVPAPYAAAVAGDGRFTIRDVPAGTYMLHAWHERAGEVIRPLAVGPPGASDVHLTLDARDYVPTPHLNKFGLPYTATRADRY